MTDLGKPIKVIETPAPAKAPAKEPVKIPEPEKIPA